MRTETFGQIISEDDANKNYGFIYHISVAGKNYIGKKCFTKGTNWKTYQSSSKEIKQLLKTNEGTYTVLTYAETNRQLTYLEVSYQFKLNVLEDESYLNSNILGKFFKGRTK